MKIAMALLMIKRYFLTIQEDVKNCESRIEKFHQAKGLHGPTPIGLVWLEKLKTTTTITTTKFIGLDQYDLLLDFLAIRRESVFNENE